MVFFLIRFRCMCTAEDKNVEVWSNSITTWTMRCLSSCPSLTSTFIASWKMYGQTPRPVLTPQSPRPLMCQEGMACYWSQNDECWLFEWGALPYNSTSTLQESRDSGYGWDYGCNGAYKSVVQSSHPTHNSRERSSGLVEPYTFINALPKQWHIVYTSGINQLRLLSACWEKALVTKKKSLIAARVSKSYKIQWNKILH